MTLNSVTTTPLLVFGGFGFSPDILKPPFPPHAQFIDSNLLVEHLLDGSKLKNDWPKIIPSLLPQNLFSSPVTCAGWSLGGLIVLGLIKAKLCNKAILLSPTLSFCTNNSFAFGLPKQAVMAMRRQLRTNAPEVISAFTKDCGYIGHNSLSIASKTALNAGLLFLEQCSFDKETLPQIPLLTFHGNSDSIIPSRASQQTTKLLGAKSHELAGSHVFFLSNTEFCLKEIAQFIE